MIRHSLLHTCVRMYIYIHTPIPPYTHTHTPIHPYTQPLVQEYGELGSRSTSPIDDTPQPTYSTRLEPISEDVEPESDGDMDGMERTMID